MVTSPGSAGVPPALLQARRITARPDRTVNIQAYLRAWLDPVKLPGGVSLTIDVDPQSFL